tara:strand:- start:11290 stop:12189 length:900 start_codon:yes stop_codon:yes gene_type:complete
MILDSLISHADAVGAPKVVGRYRVLRVCPDPVANEWFNVGVHFRQKGGGGHSRILGNLNGFKTLYGGAGVSNLNNLLSVVSEAAESGCLDNLGPHIRAGDEQYAAGDSPGAIVDQMFDTFVTLGRAAEDASDQTGRNEGLSTHDLRKFVLGQVRSAYPGLYRRSFHDHPVALEDPADRRKREYDLPVFRQPTLEGGATRFASIISAFVKTDMNRAYHLDRGALTLLNARDVLKQSGRAEGAFFILRPHEGVQGFSEEVMQKIDDDIDNAAFHFRHDSHFQIEVFEDSRSLAEHAIHYAS